ncbi:SLC13 family permease [Neobacillus mesonae]|uniref:SLC13 family permease n=1 Tax=Neobacillus mesonae TaxID=1193713 RepID=UPI002E20C39E|nr:SLC13 family permease [Neobacillus mesonae]
MTWEIAFVLFCISLMIGCLILEMERPEIIVFITVVIFLASGIISTGDAFKGFSNEGVLTIALFFIIAGGIQKSDLTNIFIHKMLNSHKSARKSLPKILIPISAMSAFLNNTPIVVTFTPIIRNWCEKNNISPSKFLIPLSYATILGGTITIIGTSTNLVVHGLLLDNNLPGFSFFQLGIVGIPITLLGILYITTIGFKLLPNHPVKNKDMMENSRKYFGELKVTEQFLFINQTIKDAKLRNLNGLYLIGIIRDQHMLTPVTSSTLIKAGDRLIFAGMISTIADLQNQKGLELVTESGSILEQIKNKKTKIVEAVVSQHSSLIHKKIRNTNFRGRYDAAVIAVHRKNERIESKIGDITLKPGDILLMITGDDFPKRDYSHDFYIVNSNNEFDILPSITRFKSWITLIILVSLIFFVSVGFLSMLKGAAVAVILLFFLKVITPKEAKDYIDFNVLLLIASSFGIGSALINSGTAEWIANGLLSIVNPLNGGIFVLIIIYLATNILTEIITNNAAAVMMFPIAMEVAVKTLVDPLALAVIVAIAASASFSTPIGYQTNMIVYSPGGYSFKDYLKVGIPLNLIVMTTTIIIVYFIWIL